MLQLKKISKNYELGKKKDKTFQVVHALKEVDLEFRKNEFVSILGPSGCGKTTLLNIIGGLDKYSSGDLIINEKSTKSFKDSDWDTYRNHSIGFVFQSYNLIPHLTILQNVELALTVSGISKEERKKKAEIALDKVGLKDRMNTRPNQLSGGQMQRVAIARALINDPEIILADEPTGALDSKTSVQIMNLLKKISKDKLIIMVTHNPELAENYSSRIIKLLDGSVVDDSNPYISSQDDKKDKVLSVSDDKDLSKKDVKKKKKKTRMSFFTAIALSFKNLLTKKMRTLLVSFAGSIGIIGIALVLAVSSGFQGYIANVQEDSLSTYPVLIQEQSMQFSPATLFGSIFSQGETDKDKVDGDYVYPAEVVTKFFNKIAETTKPNDVKNFNKYLNENKNKVEDNINAIQYTYDLNMQLFNSRNEMVAPKSKALFDLILTYSIKFFEKNAFVEIVQSDDIYTIKATGLNDNRSNLYVSKYIRDELKTAEFITNRQTTLSREELIEVIDRVTFENMQGLGNLDLTIKMFENYDLNSVNEMLDNETLIKSQYEVVAGNWANESDEFMLVVDKNNSLNDYVLYALGFLDFEQMKTSIENSMSNKDNNITIDYESIVGNSEENNYKLEMPTYKYTQSTVKSRHMKIAGIIRPMENSKNACLKPGLIYSKELTNELIVEHNKFIDDNSSLEDVVSKKIKKVDINDPKTIAIYVSNFKGKEKLKDFINDYNEFVKNDDDIKTNEVSYNDSVDAMMSSVTTIVDAITYILVAFVSISLVVSSIMIGIITYISVIERTKEIGVLRAIGASKRDVKRVFTAESLIIGFLAGVIGIVITIILCFPVTWILNAAAGLDVLVRLPILGGVILLVISMILTFISGLIPAKIASKKDPVIALRTE